MTGTCFTGTRLKQLCPRFVYKRWLARFRGHPLALDIICRGAALGALALLVGCSLLYTRPVQEMSDTSAALRAAKEAQADVLAPELYRQANEWFIKARKAYKFKDFELAQMYARKARRLAEQAEFEVLRSGGAKSDTPADNGPPPGNAGAPPPDNAAPPPDAGNPPGNNPDPNATPVENLPQQGGGPPPDKGAPPDPGPKP